MNCWPLPFIKLLFKVMGCCLDIVKLMITVIRVKVTKQYYKYQDIEVTVENYYEQSIET